MISGRGRGRGGRGRSNASAAIIEPALYSSEASASSATIGEVNLSSQATYNYHATSSNIVQSSIRKCSIFECEEREEVDCRPCLECTIANQTLRFCAMHTPHASHSNQSGFVGLRSQNVEKENAEDLSSSSSSSSSSSLIMITEAAPKPDNIVTTSSSNTTALTPAQEKIIMLFMEGFTVSTHSNISPEVKIVNALNWSQYKRDLLFLADHFNLSVTKPSLEDLGKDLKRRVFIEKLIEAYLLKYK
jgi:hypothetical protein